MDISKIPSWLLSIAIALFVAFVIFLYVSDNHFYIGEQPIGFKKVELQIPTKLPVGSIIAWHTNDSKGGQLPVGWVECNGQKITDAESVFKESTIPRLNEPKGMGRYLRGTTEKTGVTQASTKHPYVWGTGTPTQGLPSSHNLYYPSVRQPVENADYIHRTPKTQQDWKVSSVNGKVITGGNDPTKGHAEQYYTSRPNSVTVRWIMRIK